MCMGQRTKTVTCVVTEALSTISLNAQHIFKSFSGLLNTIQFSSSKLQSEIQAQQFLLEYDAHD